MSTARKIFEKYGQVTGTNAFLTPSVENWLNNHGTIRVGYLDNMLPFCKKDATTGELYGALNDYLAHAPTCIRNSTVRFSKTAYSSRELALEALKKGEIDCVFPVNLGLSDSESMDVLISNSVVQAEMFALIRSDQSSIGLATNPNLKVALAEEHDNTEAFLKDFLPDSTIIFYPDMEKSLRAVANNVVDCVFVDSYRINELEKLRERYSLAMVPTGATMPLSFAIQRDSHELYSIMNKIVNLTSDGELNAYLATYGNLMGKVTLMQFLMDNLLAVLLFLLAVFSVVLFLLWQKLKAEQKVNEQQKQLVKTREIAYTDSLTGVKSKHSFVDAEKRMDQRIAQETNVEFAIGIFDLNDLKKVNDTIGHDAGDRYIQEASRLICGCFKKSPVFRIGGDEFAVILEGEDYGMQDELLEAFDKQMEENRNQGKIVISTGLSRFEPGKDHSFRNVFKRADAQMYERQRFLKGDQVIVSQRVCRWLLSLLLFMAMVSLPVHAQEDGAKVVRVGWYESPFNTMDSVGRRSGYAYEYQQKIAAYTGWSYEYVEGSWSELMKMLERGEIDLMSDVSYTQERTKHMFFSNIAMGAEEYYIFALPGNEEIRQDEPHSLDGKNVGVNKGSVQAGFYREWAEKYGVEANLIELINSEMDAMEMMQRGELDAYLTLDAYGGQDTAIPVFKVGSSDFFFAVNKDRIDLLEELNGAMNQIQDENRYFNQQLSMKYISTSGANLYLSMNEKNWLEEHGTIRIGYQDNFLAFCAADGTTGGLIGALKDYLDHASVCFKNAQLDFESVAYPTVGEAINALKNGEVDCMFPSNLSTADGENIDLIMTPAMMSTDIYAVVRKEDRDSFSEKGQVITAVEENEPNYDAVLLDHFPHWKAKYYPDIQACLKAVSQGEADCVLISNYQYNSLSRLCEQYGLTLLATGEDVDFYFAVNRGSNELYSILARTTNLVSHTTINAALNYYSSDTNITLLDFIRANPVLVSLVFVTVLALIIIVIFQARLIGAQKEVAESQHMVENLNKQVFVDALTHVQNKGGYDNYIHQLQSQIDQGEAMDLAIGVFDCDNLKLINDRFGHDKGDKYLLASTKLICRIFQHSPVFRIGGDEFVAVLLGEDFEKKDELSRQFQEEQDALRSAKDKWEQVSISYGIAVYDAAIDTSIKSLIGRADKLMYEHKRQRKMSRNNKR